MSKLIFLAYSAFLLQLMHHKTYCFRIADNDWNSHNHLRSIVEAHDDTSLSREETQLQVFFHYDELKLGSKIPIYFPPREPSTTPRLLSKRESDSIPFSWSRLPDILELLSFPEGSKQAAAIRSTLRSCELPPVRESAMFCGTSLELMIDSVREIFGPTSKFSVLATNYLSESMSPLQNYTISEPPPLAIPAPRSVACHMLPYAYAVYYCHGQYTKDNRLYEVSLVGDDGARVQAVAVCHMDTSDWDPANPAFRVLRTVPGASPVCHFFPADNLLWIQIS